MNTDMGKTIRLCDFIDSGDNRSLLLDTTVASSLGATPGLEDLAQLLMDLNYFLDGIIVNPGGAEHHADLLGGKERAAMLVRLDWTNACRGADFPLPAASFKRVMISDAGDALELGASAAVVSLFMGFDDDAEARSIASLSHLARDCYRLALPLVVDIRPIGGKIDRSNFAGSVMLGISFMQELGADALIIPDCGTETHSAIGKWISIPALVRTDAVPGAKKVAEIIDAGLAGIVLSEAVLAADNYPEKIKKLHSQLHSYVRDHVESTG